MNLRRPTRPQDTHQPTGDAARETEAEHPPTQAKPRAAGIKVLAVLGVLVACVVLSACGSSSRGSNGSAGASNQGTKQENSRLKFTACMREHGVKIPETNSGGGAPAGLANIPRSTFRQQGKLSEVLRGKLGPAAGGNQTQITDTIVKFAGCLRETGINISDPTGSGTSGLQGFFQQLQQARQSPTFAAASKKCQSLLPKRGKAAARVAAARRRRSGRGRVIRWHRLSQVP